MEYASAILEYFKETGCIEDVELIAGKNNKPEALRIVTKKDVKSEKENNGSEKRNN